MVDLLPQWQRESVRLKLRIRKYEVIRECHEEKGWSIKWMCQVLEISRGSYYAWCNRKPSARELENSQLLETIRDVHENNNGLFGYRKMTLYLKTKHSLTVNKKRVRRLLRLNDLPCTYRKKSRSHWKKSEPQLTAENVLNRKFQPDRPNQVWCTDVTEIKIPGTPEKLYISTILDLYDRCPVSWSFSVNNDSQMVSEMMDKAYAKYPEGCKIFHSDRGCLYTRAGFQKDLEKRGITSSMSRVSRCIDNGPMEGFQGQLKDICRVLFPDVKSVSEMKEALEKTFRYYMDEYPQARYDGKTAGQVREEAMSGEVREYPIKPNSQVKKFWSMIEEKQRRNAVSAARQTADHAL